MNFKEFWYQDEQFEVFRTTEDYCCGAWDACKNEIIKLLEENKELEAVSQNGKKVYKIYGNVIEKIRKNI